MCRTLCSGIRQSGSESELSLECDEIPHPLASGNAAILGRIGQLALGHGQQLVHKVGPDVGAQHGLFGQD